MRYKEFEKANLKPFQVVIALSEHASAATIVYANSQEDAIMLARKLYGRNAVVGAYSANKENAVTPQDLESTIQYWGNRLRKYAKLASKPSNDYLTHRTRADKARWELQRLLRLDK